MAVEVSGDRKGTFLCKPNQPNVQHIVEQFNGDEDNPTVKNGVLNGVRWKSDKKYENTDKAKEPDSRKDEAECNLKIPMKLETKEEFTENLKVSDGGHDKDLVLEYPTMKALIHAQKLDAYKRFCSSLKKSCSEIIAIAATKTSEDNYDFVVITPNPMQTKQDVEELFPKIRDYPITYRQAADEGKLVQYKIIEVRKSECHAFNHAIKPNVREALIKYGKELMEQHKNLNAIHFCPYKSIGFLDGHQQLKAEQCIVLYVNMKFPNGRVLVGEKEFPRELDGVSVDVRENYIVPLAETRIGQEVVSNVAKKSGSLGPVVKFPDDSLGFLTSMHAVIKKEELSSIEPTGQAFVPSVRNEISNIDGKDIGFVQEYHYYEGMLDAEPGFEVALVKFYPGKHPQDALFPADNKYGTLHFNGAQYLSDIREIHHDTPVFKCGAASGLTRGRFDIIAPNFNRFKCSDEDSEITLYDQISILEIEGYPFARPGDSGAIVVVPDSGDTTKLKAIGIVTAQMNTRQYIVSPIAPILALFPRCELKRYT